jgi:type III secretory pathway component EscV
MKKADIGVALYLLAAVIFFIVPISSTLLDVMIAINISIALIILFNTLFVKEVLDMSFFPTLLLSSKQLFYHHLGIKYFQIIRNALSICHIRQICP